VSLQSGGYRAGFQRWGSKSSIWLAGWVLTRMRTKAQILPRVDIVPLAGADQRVQNRRAPATGVAAHEKIIFPSQADRAQRVLAEIVVGFENAIVDKARQRRPLIER